MPRALPLATATPSVDVQPWRLCRSLGAWAALSVTPLPTAEVAADAGSRPHHSPLPRHSLPGLSTDGNTGQTDCLYVQEGYYLQQGNPKPCPVGTFAEDARLKSLATFCSSW